MTRGTTASTSAASSRRSDLTNRIPGNLTNPQALNVTERLRGKSATGAVCPGGIATDSGSRPPAMDYDSFKSINDFTSRHDWIEDVLSFIAQDAHYIFAALLAVLFLLPTRWASPN